MLLDLRFGHFVFYGSLLLVLIAAGLFMFATRSRRK